ncbi:MAG: thioredoxin-disulfide reductase [Alphaproteobacteria bacterium]|nr:thioredoxin-disulfide reductase [Alphaproteobacteria bacterium]
MHFDVAIIGAGPAGYTAAIYASRANLNTVLITGNLDGGQLLYTHKIENFPGVPSISGPDLIQIFQQQAQNLKISIIFEKICSVNLKKTPFLLQLSDKTDITADSVIIACGATPKWLNIPSEEKFKGRGISVCATCDGYFYRQKDVVIAGGGNTALYEAIFLSSIAKHLTIVNLDSQLGGEFSLRKQVLNNPKIDIINESIITHFDGDKRLENIKIKNVKTAKEKTIKTDAVFIAIGQTPNTTLFKGQLEMDKDGYLITDCQTRQTSVKGVFAAGDVQEKTFRQAIIACGTGAIAALGAEKYLIKKNK